MDNEQLKRIADAIEESKDPFIKTMEEGERE